MGRHQPCPRFEMARPALSKKKEEALKKRSAAASKAAAEEKKANKEKRRVIFKKGESYAKEYAAAERNAVRLNRQAKQNGGIYTPADPKVAFVIRIRGINSMDPKSRKILQLLRLRQINNGVFVKLNKATINMIRLVHPYVTYGYPNLKSVKELLYKRGYASIKKNRIPLTDNSVIEGELGKHGIMCMEDLVHEI